MASFAGKSVAAPFFIVLIVGFGIVPTVRGGVLGDLRGAARGKVPERRDAKRGEDASSRARRSQQPEEETRRKKSGLRLDTIASHVDGDAPDRNASDHRDTQGHHSHRSRLRHPARRSVAIPPRPGCAGRPSVGMHLHSPFRSPYVGPIDSWSYQDVEYYDIVPVASEPPRVAQWDEPVVVEERLVQPTIGNEPVASTIAPWNARLGLAYLGDVESTVNRLGIDMLANVTGSFGIDTDVTLLRESIGDISDWMWLGDFNIVYELFPSEVVRPRIGIGVNWLSDQYGSDGGLNITAGADWQLGPRLTMTAEADFGTIGAADYIHGNATIGFRHSSHVEWYGGYDWLEIGGVPIHGLTGGIRFRF